MQNQVLSQLRKMLSLLLALTIALGPSALPAFAGAKKGKKGDSTTATPINHYVARQGPSPAKYIFRRCSLRNR